MLFYCRNLDDILASYLTTILSTTYADEETAQAEIEAYCDAVKQYKEPENLKVSRTASGDVIIKRS